MPTHRIVALACLLFAFAGCATRPDTTTPPTLLLVSVDGLRPADITAERMPALNALGDTGVRAEGMRRLRDPGYLLHGASGGDPLRFEKRLLDDWLARELPR